MTQSLQNIRNLIDACVQKGGFFKDADTVELMQKSFREVAFQVGEYERMKTEIGIKASTKDQTAEMVHNVKKLGEQINKNGRLSK
jgi:hypothetical protein